MPESSGFIVATSRVSHPYSPETPSRSRTTLPVETQSSSDDRTLWSIRFTSST